MYNPWTKEKWKTDVKMREDSGPVWYCGKYYGTAQEVSTALDKLEDLLLYLNLKKKADA